MSIMSPGFLAILVIVSLLIIWVSFWITNKAYGRKPDVIDPIPSSKKNDEQEGVPKVNSGTPSSEKLDEFRKKLRG
ncbi:hypothetical protein ACQKK5_23480 [Brevibacillus panacihumi]|uniref:hypothetical protein n=1 Tax=Brevibacillus panacihumi TaxID=497735 RepID=UPI003D059865